MAKKYVYYFGDGKAEGTGTMKDLLGGKGAGLAEMTNLKVSVPPGFTISTEACVEYYKRGKAYPPGMMDEALHALKRVERSMKAGFGDPDNPLLVSVRSGARASMPGMMAVGAFVVGIIVCGIRVTRHLVNRYRMRLEAAARHSVPTH